MLTLSTFPPLTKPTVHSIACVHTHIPWQAILSHYQFTLISLGGAQLKTTGMKTEEMKVEKMEVKAETAGTSEGESKSFFSLLFVQDLIPRFY